MPTSLSLNPEYQAYSFLPSYENVHALLAEIHVYVFDKHGLLVDSQPVKRGKATISARFQDLADARVVIGPAFNDGLAGIPTLEEARLHYVFETELKFEPDRASYELPPVPEAIWRWWMVHSLWKNVRDISARKSRLLLW